MFSVDAGSSVLVGFLTWILRSVVVGWAVVLLWEVAMAESLQRPRWLPETRTRNPAHVLVGGLTFWLAGHHWYFLLMKNRKSTNLSWKIKVFRCFRWPLRYADNTLLDAHDGVSGTLLCLKI